METPSWANQDQKDTIEMIVSYVEDILFGKENKFDNAIVFEGEGIDGPAIGYIEIGGEVTWICGG